LEESPTPLRRIRRLKVGGAFVEVALTWIVVVEGMLELSASLTVKVAW